MNNSWIDPVLVAIGPIEVRWYGLMYVVGFAVGSWLLGRLALSKFWPLPKESIDKYVTALIIGMFLGARTFYVFIYNWGYYSQHLNEIFHVWRGGLSFHGAVVGMCLATLWFARNITCTSCRLPIAWPSPEARDYSSVAWEISSMQNFMAV